MIHPVPARLEDAPPSSPRKYRRPRHQPPPPTFKWKKSSSSLAGASSSSASSSSGARGKGRKIRSNAASYTSLHEALQAQKMEQEVHGKSFGRSCEEDDFQAVRDVLGEDDTLTDDNIFHAHLLSARGSSTSSPTRGRPPSSSVAAAAAYTKQQQQPSHREAWDYLIEDDFAQSDASSSDKQNSSAIAGFQHNMSPPTKLNEEKDLMNTSTTISSSSSVLNVGSVSATPPKEGRRKECTNIMYDDSLAGILQLVEAAAMES